MIFRDRRFERSVDAPTETNDALAECLVWQACAFGPLPKRELFAVVFVTSNAASIQALFERCRPAHILRLVVAVVVDAIDAVRRAWAWAYIVSESRERFQPGIAYDDASSTVILVLGRVRAVAAFFHCAPRAVLGCVCSAVSLVGLHGDTNYNPAECV